jgi:hypothetical protein
MTAPLVTGHVWRRFSDCARPAAVAEGGCAFMNCGRLREEHERAAGRGDRTQDGIVAAREAAES